MKKDDKEKVVRNLEQSARSLENAWVILDKYPDVETSSAVALCKYKVVDIKGQIQGKKCRE